MSIAALSNGTLLKIGDGGGPEIFTTVPEVMRLGVGETKFDLIDITSHDDPTLFRQFLAGLSDGDELDFEINWRPSNSVHQRLRTDNQNATLRNFKVIYPDTSQNTCLISAFVMSIRRSADVGQPMRASGRLKIVGAPTWS